MRRGKARYILKRLDYLPRWAWYALSFFIGAGPIGLVIVYLAFHMLEKVAQDEEEEAESSYSWNVDIDRDGVHVRRGPASATYRDSDCVVTDDAEVERQWQRAQTSADRAWESTKTSAASSYAASDRSGENEVQVDADASVADVIREGNEALRRLRRADEIIADPQLSAQIVSIEQSCSQILSILQTRPQVLPQLRTFLRYYLPTTLKLLEARSKLENNANTPKARQVCERISEAIGAVDVAFKKQVEALDEYRFIDLESEMDVLRDMLKADGLVDEEQEEEDPFAKVLSDRRNKGGSTGGTPMATP